MNWTQRNIFNHRDKKIVTGNGHKYILRLGLTDIGYTWYVFDEEAGEQAFVAADIWDMLRWLNDGEAEVLR